MKMGTDVSKMPRTSPSLLCWVIRVPSHDMEQLTMAGVLLETNQRISDQWDCSQGKEKSHGSGNHSC